MKPLFTEEDYKNAKSLEKLSCECYYCGKPFLVQKKYITSNIKLNKGGIKFCNHSCVASYKNDTLLGNEKPREVQCKNCSVSFIKLGVEILASPNHFCGRSCAASYNNSNKSHGNRRSKLEIWLEKELVKIYPNLTLDFNKKDAISSELDIYIPALKLAFEINGILHYKAIYGEEKFAGIIANDIKKAESCTKAGIRLITIDASELNYFKPCNAQPYLDIIVSHINV